MQGGWRSPGRFVLGHPFNPPHLIPLVEVLGKLEVATSALIVDGKDNDNLRLSARNLQKHSVLPPEGVNLYDLLRHDTLVLTKKAVEALEQRCA